MSREKFEEILNTSEELYKTEGGEEIVEEHKDILLFINKLMELGEKEGYNCASFSVKGKGRKRGMHLTINFHKKRTVTF